MVLQFTNASFSIRFKQAGKITVAIFVFAKALSEITSTGLPSIVSGITTEVSFPI